MHKHDEAVFDQFSRVTGIPYPSAVESFLPPGGLFVGKWAVVGVAIVIGLAWWGKLRADRQREEESETEAFEKWRRERV